MPDYSKRHKELAKVAARQAQDELVKEQADIFAFADRNREIVELPPGLENGYTRKRKRGLRTDTDCINEICEIVAQGITATAAVKYVGLPWATWQNWLRRNHEQAREKFNVAYDAHLEVMADNTIRIYEKLMAQRETARKTYFTAKRAWRKACSKLKEGEPHPTAPEYEGPEEWELSLAEKRVKVRLFHLEKRHERYAKMEKQLIEQKTNVTISHNVNLRRDPREAMQSYIKLIDSK